MIKRLALVSVLALSSACAAVAHDTSPVAPEPLGQAGTLIALRAVDALPDADYVAEPGYPGSGYHVGAFVDAASWRGFVAANGRDPFATMDMSIDWRQHMVAFIVLDAQTNDLTFSSWTVDGAGAAVLTASNSGIEPFYADSTPALLVVVPRTAGFTAVVNGDTVGTVRL